MASADLLPALRKYLQDNVNSVSDRVFNEELPEGEAPSMPRKCIVLKEAGGYGNRGTLSTETQRVLITCYGETAYEARAVRRDLHEILKGMKPQIVEGTDANFVKILSAVEASGPLSLRDPDTRWNYTQSTWMVMLRDEVVSS